MNPFLTKHWNLFTTLILLASGIWTLASLAPENAGASSQPPAPRQDFRAPEFSLAALDGTEISLSELRGQPVVVNFWATWCPPCRAEMPAMEKLYAEYAPQGLVVLGVNATAQDNPDAIAPFVESYGLTFPILLDTSNQVFRLYQVRSLPTTFFIDPQGVIREVVIGGPMAEALLRVRIEQLFLEVE